MRKRVAVWAVVAVLIVSAALIGFQVRGGFIAIHNESYLPPSNESVGSTIGVSRYLSAGSHQRVEVEYHVETGVSVR